MNRSNRVNCRMLSGKVGLRRGGEAALACLSVFVRRLVESSSMVDRAARAPSEGTHFIHRRGGASLSERAAQPLW